MSSAPLRGDGRQVPAEWLLPFTASDPAATDGDGRPWGDGTAMAARAWRGDDPWDDGCLVTPMIGGHETMSAICEAFEAAIAEAAAQAGSGVPPGRRGHVYVAGWLFNAARDLSSDNAWGGEPWGAAAVAREDRTALGLVLRMMSAGIAVRMLLWMPTTLQRTVLKSHADEHWNVAAAVQDHEAALQDLWPGGGPYGVVALDLRSAAPITASIHQKAIVVRVGQVNVAFCGGVDLGFTRRDFGRPPDRLNGIGDWQSGDTIPPSAAGWPKAAVPPAGGYPPFPATDTGRFPEDLPASVYGQGYRHWHDQHLKLEGPIVTTLEQQFAERWVIDTNGRVHLFNRRSVIGRDDQVQLTSAAAISGRRVVPLPAPSDTPPAGDARVQMWRTIPLRAERAVGPFVRGELTVMAGVANAMCRARELVTIWDQFFWSEPLARLVAARLLAEPGLRVMIVLPPYGTGDPGNELKLRRNALQRLWRSLDPPARRRVLVFDAWSAEAAVGIYVHAKVQTYDDALLVCGSANLNRRSFECDIELDCAVRHPPTVRAHLARLHLAVTGAAWDDFGDGWLTRIWQGFRAGEGRSLIADPFFRATVARPATPNGVPIPSDGLKPSGLFEPTSIGPDLYGHVCASRVRAGDPGVPGRLDEVTYLLERCHDGEVWPWRRPAISAAVALPRRRRAQPDGEEPFPRLTP